MGKMEADLQILTEKEQQSLLEIAEFKRRSLETAESNAEHEGRQTELSKEIHELRESLEQLAAENTEKDSQIARLESKHFFYRDLLLFRNTFCFLHCACVYLPFPFNFVYFDSTIRF